MPEAADIARMFDRIAARYDLANHVLSFGLDFLWRRRLVRAVAAHNPCAVADLATGSGDVAFALKKHLGPAVAMRGLDFSREMLAVAERKKSVRPWAHDIVFEFGDALNLPLADASVDAVTIAFGLRNFEDRARGLREMRRVLRPGGRLFVLEFSQPVRWFAPLYFFYMRHVARLVAGWLTGQPDAYRYLAASVAEFPDRGALCDEICAAGLTGVRASSLALGAVALHEACA